MEAKRQIVMQFIRHQFGDYQFDRMKSQNEECGFSTLDGFILHNERCVRGLKSAELNATVRLCEMIQAGKIDLVDEDNFVEFGACAIYYNKDNKLVIMHPR